MPESYDELLKEFGKSYAKPEALLTVCHTCKKRDIDGSLNVIEIPEDLNKKLKYVDTFILRHVCGQCINYNLLYFTFINKIETQELTFTQFLNIKKLYKSGEYKKIIEEYDDEN